MPRLISLRLTALNRLQSQSAGGPLRVAGSVSERHDSRPATVASDNTFSGTASVDAGTTTFSVTATDASANVRTQSYSIDTSAPTRTFTHDANGNLTSDGVRNFEWDAAGRLVAVTAGTHRSEFT